MAQQTPKEKALDLIATYRYILSLPNAPLGDNKDAIAKQCALIVVDEVYIIGPWSLETDIKEDSKQYWQEVKEELEKL